MNNIFLVFAIVFFSLQVHAQEINASIKVNAEQTSVGDLQVFKTLENELNEFVNETKWTDRTYARQERVNCSMVIIVRDYDSDSFEASIQIQAARPVYGSTYSSPIYNYNDRDFNFTYKEFQSLNFNPNRFDTNLISVIAFHVYTVLGLDASSFSENGGEKYHEIAKQIVNTAASSNSKGWKASDGNQSRYQLNEALLSQVFSDFHQVMYDYHRKGLDVMHKDNKAGKEAIAESLNLLKSINDKRPNSFLLRTFFDAKAEEIQRVFSGGPSVQIDQLVQNLTRMAPTKRSNWSEIKF